MPNFSIYKVWSESLPDDIVYYGKTTRTLKKRLQAHESTRDTSINIILDAGNYHIVEVERCVGATKQEASIREGWWQRNNECVNIRMEGRTPGEYYQEKKEQILLYQKTRRQEKKETINYTNRKYRAKDPERWTQYGRDYDARNKEKIGARKQEKIHCVLCDSIVSRGNIRLHQRSQKCQTHTDKEVGIVMKSMLDILE